MLCVSALGRLPLRTGARAEDLGHSLNPVAAPAPAPQGSRCVYPPAEPGGAALAQVEVVAEDLDRLGEEEFLNDTLIDFYLKCV